ncbi:MAG: transcription antitermination factor NusB [Deltaproteobacteria bacterium]|nr:transcription antitermination factor NusB [Deltaproteobacteria bacterium]
MGVRRQARECALQIVFQLDAWPNPSVSDADDAIARFFDNFDAPDERARTLASAMARGVTEKRKGLDELVQKHSPRWKIPRMAMVDRNILRVAAWELSSDAETPATVVIDEAVEIAKRFGAEQSAAFVNGVLDGLARELGRLATAGRGPDGRFDGTADGKSERAPSDMSVSRNG